jgi:hypothetical protein
MGMLLKRQPSRVSGTSKPHKNVIASQVSDAVPLLIGHSCRDLEKQ